MSVRARVKNVLFDRIPGCLRRGPALARRVALTFDDGPDDYTARYLDKLDELGVPATFFVCGRNAELHPDLVREYRRRGHQLAGHGFDHQRFSKLGRRGLLDQCAKTDRAIGGQVSGRSWVRPPHGDLDVASIATLLANSYTIALWSFDACDYEDKDAASLVARCAPSNVVPGDVLLFHEGQAWTLEALAPIVEGLRGAGYECVTMYDLFAT